MKGRFEFLRCPETGEELELFSLSEAETVVGGKLRPVRSAGAEHAANAPAPIGPTEKVLLRKDRLFAYPVVDGVPVLLIPEILGTGDRQRVFSLTDEKYAESYAEMAFYNQKAIEESGNIHSSEAYRIIAPMLGASKENLYSFPDPKDIYIDDIYDCLGQWEAYNHIAPVRGKRVLQLGGKGIHAVKFLLAGAKEAWVLSPMIGELMCAECLGECAGVSGRLHGVAGIAEEMPFMDGFFDTVYSGGCIHHMETALALPEIARVLCSGGTFCAVDPWLT
ncbi:methyltransferase domain-containing protein, partial [Thermodesulfobacteriota bacterium]